MDHKFYVYVWINDDDNEIFYVGKGSGNRCARIGGQQRNAWFMNIVRKHKCHHEIIIDNLTEAEAFDMEKLCIKHLRDLDCPLTNLCDGGEGQSGRIITDEYREKYRIMNTGTGNPNYGNHWSDQQKEHLSKVRKDKQLARYGNNPRAKPVMCVETGEIYSCQQEAADDIHAKSMTSISHALEERRFTASNLHFVCGDDIATLNTLEKREAYLREIEYEKVALRSNAY